MADETPDNFAAFVPILHAQSISIAEMKRDVSDLVRDVALINRHLLEGNGRPSLLERVALMERTMVTAVESIRNLTQFWEARATEAEKGKWSFLTSIICTLITLAGVVFTAMVALGK